MSVHRSDRPAAREGGDRSTAAVGEGPIDLSPRVPDGIPAGVVETSGVDLQRSKAFEAVFPDRMVWFLTELNFTRSGEDVFRLLVRLAEDVGLGMVVYEYCSDAFVDDPSIFMRTNLPEAMVRMESWVRRAAKLAGRDGPGNVFNYGRRHTALKWTPGVAGVAFTDMYAEYPDYQRKLKLVSLLPGMQSGIGIPLRCPDPRARAGLTLAGRAGREAALELVESHGPTLVALGWAAHMRILQHMHPASRSDVLGLTERQIRYVRLVADGLLDKEIAHAMSISYSGARKYQEAVCRKLGVRRRGEIAAAAGRHGLLLSRDVDTSPSPDAMWDAHVFYGGPRPETEGPLEPSRGEVSESPSGREAPLG